MPRKKSEENLKIKTIGRLPPRYKFILNQYNETRLSSCPICEKPTHMRKFALLIFIEDCGFLTLGKTCRYCTPCELIAAHQDELEDEMFHAFETRNPDVIGNPYMVLGTVDKRHWKASLETGGMQMDELLDNTADFSSVLDFHFTPACWMPAELVEPNKTRPAKK